MPHLRLDSQTNRKQLSLNWTQLNAITAGVSAIDLGSLAIRNRDDAHRFAREYGFNMESKEDWERANQAHQEAMTFIDQTFLDPTQRLLVDSEVRHPKNVLDLLIFSSNYLNKSESKQRWACALLKVMHGIFHIDLDVKLKNFDEIRRQIFRSLDRLIKSSGENHFLTDRSMSLPLYFLQKKRNKNRESILLKLLQKPSYVASDIYDHLGLRLIFHTKVECLLGLKLLTRNHHLSVTNIKPFRSHNNLLDLKQAKKVFTRLKPAMAQRDHYPADIFREMDKELEKSFLTKAREGNPHSSSDFQSIQITVRKMIRIPNPAYTQMLYLRELAHSKGIDLAEDAIPGRIDPELSFYFDYEVQLMDKKSFLRSMNGPSSHDAYKKRQKETARRRVLGKELVKMLHSSMEE